MRQVSFANLINRSAIVERVLAGAGEPAGQMVPEGMGGYDPSLKPMTFDPEGAPRSC
jgi:peptide/nickel transport system substrate-binding protein